MSKLSLAAAALAALIAIPGTSVAQGISIGPEGVRVDDGRRGYEERRRGPSREVCRELRRACMHKEELGEEGAGNCRRYRRTCT
nr:hypothetical protein [Methylobacterium segetis]